MKTTLPVFPPPPLLSVPKPTLCVQSPLSLIVSPDQSIHPLVCPSWEDREQTQHSKIRNARFAQSSCKKSTTSTRLVGRIVLFFFLVLFLNKVVFCWYNGSNLFIRTFSPPANDNRTMIPSGYRRDRQRDRSGEERTWAQ